MAVKAKVSLVGNQTFQHHNGKIESQITRLDLERNPNMVRTHAHLYENAQQLMREDSLKGVKNNATSEIAKAHVAIIKEKLERSIVFSAAAPATKQQDAFKIDNSALASLAKKLNDANKASLEVETKPKGKK